ncbi:MAG: DUF1194 domain-containing protein [Acetobacteraceae bacterium]
MEAVDVALVLAVDSSGSISSEDIALQFRGYAQAITSDVVMDTVRSGRHGRIALAFAAWSSAGQQDQLVPWMLIDGMSAARQFAATLLDAPSLTPGFTSISGAIDFARQMLSACGYAADRRVIDVSGDGANNDGRPVTEARDEAIAAGIAINGLPIVRQEPDIAAYYSRNVIGGEAAFITVASDISGFHTAVLEKFATEIARVGTRTRLS